MEDLLEEYRKELGLEALTLQQLIESHRRIRIANKEYGTQLGDEWRLAKQRGYEAGMQEATQVAEDVREKIESNTWDHFGAILPTLKAISQGDWYWGANSRCKYIEIRIDTRDGGCILYDRDRVRISPKQFAYQSGGNVGKMTPWPSKNALPSLSDIREVPQQMELPSAHELGEALGRWVGTKTQGDREWVHTPIDRLGFAARHVFTALSNAPQPAIPIICYVRSGATLPGRMGMETCTAYDAGAIAVYADGTSAPVSQWGSLSYEQRHAICQGHEVISSDAYFKARPQIDGLDRRNVFRAGFDRGWDAACHQVHQGGA